MAADTTPHEAVKHMHTLKLRVDEHDRALKRARAELEDACNDFVNRWPDTAGPIVYDNYVFSLRRRTQRERITERHFIDTYGDADGHAYWVAYTAPAMREVHPPQTLAHLKHVVGDDRAARLWNSPDVVRTQSYVDIKDSTPLGQRGHGRKGASSTQPSGGSAPP